MVNSEDSSNEGSGQVLSNAEKAAQKLSTEELERKVKDVVRLALSSELRKIPLKRDEITRKVLHEHSRAFTVVMSKARERLRDIFGMDLVELPAKEKKAVTSSGTTRRGGANKDKSSSASKSYALQNILPQKLRETGLIQWDRNEEQEIMGLLTVILSLIHVNGRVLSDDQLRHYFRTLYLDNNPKFELEKLLANFVKQGYLDKQKSGFADSSSQAPEKDHVEYRWGPRAKIEMPETNLCDFIKSVYGGDAPPDIDKQIERASGIAIEN
ncbi:MAGE family-domain-containing protein [Gigaspora rosea]|uniref:MAGE family-domain-containing protein n=1 Tax=Gigaspora rosea TaxID=44941 RepID=A0A397W5C4_9GLOM|nr:MAGE family-domain-containing protein [Gigaspora rosea]